MIRRTVLEGKYKCCNQDFPSLKVDNQDKHKAYEAIVELTDKIYSRAASHYFFQCSNREAIPIKEIGELHNKAQALLHEGK